MISSSPTSNLGTEFLAFGAVHLDVVDKRRSVSWWRDVVGLELLEEQPDSAELGIDGAPLIVLRENAGSPTRPGFGGLYHLAINVPGESGFAQTLARLIATRGQVSTTDHVVAQSIYLADPDGIGLEIAVELPERVVSIDWPPSQREPVIIDADGRRRRGLEQLDVRAVLAKLPAGDLPATLPSGTHLGHVHLKVPDLDEAYAFYRDVIGLLPNNYVPVIGYGDLGTGDFRLHRVALNTWQGVGVPPRPAGMAGMDHVEVRFDSPERLRELLARLGDAEARGGGGFLVRDPAGNALVLGA